MNTNNELKDIQTNLTIIYDRLIDVRDFEQNPTLSTEIDSQLCVVLDDALFRIEALSDDVDAGLYDRLDIDEEEEEEY
jgi:tellurite resistance-related uncharacterized protein